MEDECFFGMSHLSDPILQITLSVGNSVTAISTMALNFLILLSIWKTKSLHKPSFVLVANLALVDFLTGAVSQPARVTRDVLLLNSSSELYNEICTSALITKASGYWFGGVSLFILTLISIDRILAIKLKTAYRNVFTTKRVGVALVCFWIVSGVGIQSMIFLNKTSIQLPIVLMAVIISILLTIIIVSYSRAVKELRALISQVSPAVSTPQPNGTSIFDVKKYQKSLKTMLIVFSTAMILYIPYICALVAVGISSAVAPAKMYIYFRVLSFCDFIVWSNATINPLLYLWRMRDLRQATKMTIRRMFWQQRLSNNKNTNSNNVNHNQHS